MYGDPYGNFEYGGGPVALGEPIAAIDDLILRIGNYVRTGALGEGDLSISSPLGAIPTAKISLEDPDNSIQISPGQAVRISRLGEYLFAGTVDRAAIEYPTQSAARKIAIKATGWEQLAAKRLVSAAYEKQLAGDIVRDLATRYLGSDGVTVNGVEDGLEVGPVVFRYKSLRDVISQIAQLIGYQWRISHDKDLQFFARESYSAPFDISDSNRHYVSLRIEQGRKDYRNVQVIRGGKDLIAERTYEFKGDGETQSFPLPSPCGATPTITVDSAPQTVGIRGVDDEEAADGNDWFWSKGDTQISQNQSATPLTSSEILRVTYRALIPIISMSRAQGAISDRQTVEGGSGLYEAVSDEGQIEDEELAATKGEGWLRRHARINTEIAVKTTDVGLRPGQLQRVQLTDEGIDDYFLLTSVSMRERGKGHIVTSYKAVDNVAPGGWPEFFERLARTGADFALGANEIANPIGQGGATARVGHTENTATGDNQGAVDSDPYTCWLIGDDAPIGCRYEEDGVYYQSGVVIGEVPP